jgi:hypothetical protein
MDARHAAIDDQGDILSLQKSIDEDRDLLDESRGTVARDRRGNPMMSQMMTRGSRVFSGNQRNAIQYIDSSEREIVGVADRGSDDVQGSSKRLVSEGRRFPLSSSGEHWLTPIFRRRYNYVLTNRQIVLKI